jgi:hypothetical protein
MSIDRIHDLVRSSRITPSDGALLLELRRVIAWRRLPWWKRLLHALWSSSCPA